MPLFSTIFGTLSSVLPTSASPAPFAGFAFVVSCVCMRARVSVCVCVLTRACVRVFLFLGMYYVCMYIGTYVCMYVCVYACMHPCRWVRTYTRTHARTHARTHTHTPTYCIFLYIRRYVSVCLNVRNACMLTVPESIPLNAHAIAWRGLHSLAIERIGAFGINRRYAPVAHQRFTFKIIHTSSYSI